MKIYQHWVKVTQTIHLPHGAQPSTVWGGSNVSVEDAHRNAAKKLEVIRHRIETGGRRSRDYEVAIREEIVQSINNNAVITRNRYGAEVLNVTNLMFIDIDEYFDFLGIFINRTKEQQKVKIIKRVEKLSRKYAELGFRVYDTRNGIRVIVVGRDMDPRSSESDKMMNKFNADWLYRIMCQKQNCYRARLTPKPRNMRQRSGRNTWPRDAEQQALFETWLAEYQQKSLKYAVCKYIDTFGLDRRDPLIELHDQRTKSRENLKLA